MPLGLSRIASIAVAVFIVLIVVPSMWIHFKKERLSGLATKITDIVIGTAFASLVALAGWLWVKGTPPAPVTPDIVSNTEAQGSTKVNEALVPQADTVSESPSSSPPPAGRTDHGVPAAPTTRSDSTNPLSASPNYIPVFACSWDMTCVYERPDLSAAPAEIPAGTVLYDVVIINNVWLSGRRANSDSLVYARRDALGALVLRYREPQR